jgi:hypothetical protein
VDGCEHGLVHLTLGSLTLRLRPEEVARLRRALDAAGLASARRSADAGLH